MALDLKSSVCTSSGCTVASITDNTGIYDASTNLGGYGTPNIETSDITSASIVITYQDASTVTVNVLSQIPNPLTAESFTFNDITLPSELDGEYNILYTINTASLTYSTNVCMISTCNARCCIDKMWVKAAEEASYDCGCDTFAAKALQAEGLLRALKSSSIMTNETARDKLLKTIQRLCKMEKCNC